MKTKTREYSSPACTLHQFEPGVRIKRVYEEPAATDGFRVLVDRLWPRGLTKKKAALDAWAKDIAPTPALRKWFGHDPQRYGEFRKRYRAELRPHRQEIDALRDRARQQPVTLLYGARDSNFNHAIVLRELVQRSR
ncbi:MAG TPA: DUF488 domain-containing protein [Solirubrobacteraceae bacterium]